MREHDKEPLVSIGLPVYNGARYLAEAIESILSQTYRHFELIICDNASTDGTEQICRRFATADDRVRYYRNAANLGVSRNFNLAVERASGAYFRWAADDSEVTRCLQSCPGVSFAFEPPLDALCALVERIGADGRIRHVRDRTYFEWRFRNPLSRYGFLLCDHGGLDGYLVLQEYTGAYADPTRLNVVDWEATSAPVLDRLLEAAFRVAGHRKQLFVWSATLSQEKFALLAKSRFRPVEEGAGNLMNFVLVRALVKDRPATDWLLAGRRLTDLAEWDVPMLYSMHG